MLLLDFVLRFDIPNNLLYFGLRKSRREDQTKKQYINLGNKQTMERPTKVINGETYKLIDGFDHAYWIGLGGVYSDKTKRFLKEIKKRP
jgi:hypothetical protein